jgi:tetratricopeptide (TPR) repeat protein
MSTLREAAEAARAAADYRELMRIGNEMIGVGETTGDKNEAACGNSYVGMAFVRRNDGRAAEKAFHAALRLFEQLGDQLGVGRALMSLGVIALDIDVDVATAHRLYDESIQVIRDAGDPRNLAVALGNFAEICRLEGDYELATATAEEALGIFTALPDDANAGWQLANLAHFSLMMGRRATTRDRLHAAFVHLSRDPNPQWLAYAFDVAILALTKFGQLSDGARLLGFTDKYRSESGVVRAYGLLPWFSIPVERLNKELPEPLHHALVSEGERLSAQEAQAIVERTIVG